MNILLVNANRFRQPPVIPLGLEYIATMLTEDGYTADTLDLCFCDNVTRAIDEKFSGGRYEVTAVTFRNLDSAVYHTNVSFLDDLKKTIDHIKQHDTKVVLGGSGFSIAPQEILNFTGADFGLLGPGEQAFLQMVIDIQSYDAGYAFLNGNHYDDFRYLVHQQGELFDYKKYTQAGALVGFATHSGCSESCPYCVEAGTNVIFREADCVVEELRQLTRKGFRKYHLCDPEFNQDLRYSVDFCERLAAARLNLDWALYCKPKPHSPDLFRALRASGAGLITLSVDSHQLANRYSLEDVGSFISGAQQHGLKVAVDLLMGLPYEKQETGREIVAYLKSTPAAVVGINTYIRLYKYSAVTGQVKSDPGLRDRLLGKVEGNPDYLYPVFYNHLKESLLEKWVAGDTRFHIEGRKQAVNYQRV